MKRIKNSFRFKLFGLVLFASLLLILAGCAGITESSDEIKSLTAAYDTAIISLDPYGTAHGEPATILAAKQIYDTLVVKDGEEFKPRIATEWEQPDPNTWVFKLRDDVKFHDGSNLTAEDVKSSLEQLVTRAESPLTVLWEAFDSVEATDEYTVTIKTTKPLGTMLSNLSLLFITPAEFGNEEEFFRKPIGSGPFQVESFQPEQELKLIGYKDYWNGAPDIDELTFLTIPETSSRLTALETGEIDLTWTVPNDQIEGLANNEDIELIEDDSYLYYFNWFNSSKEPFNDVRVRQALWYALDTQTIIEDLFGDTGKQQDAPIPSSVFGFSEQQAYEYNPEKARELLAEAGYPDGFTARTIWAKGSGPQILELQQTMASYWSEIGVEIEPDQLERAEWIEKLNNLDWDMDLQTNSVITGDADYTLGRLYVSEANRNGYKNEELDEILIAAKETTDQAERKELYAEANKIIWEEAVGIFPVQLKQVHAIRSHVKGFVPDPSGAPEFHQVTVE